MPRCWARKVQKRASPQPCRPPSATWFRRGGLRLRGETARVRDRRHRSRITAEGTCHPCLFPACQRGVQAGVARAERDGAKIEPGYRCPDADLADVDRRRVRANFLPGAPVQPPGEGRARSLKSQVHPHMVVAAGRDRHGIDESHAIGGHRALHLAATDADGQPAPSGEHVPGTTLDLRLESVRLCNRGGFAFDPDIGGQRGRCP